MTPRRLTLETTLYGKRLVTYGQLVELHREVSRAASIARLSDPRWQNNYAMGMMHARSKVAA